MGCLARTVFAVTGLCAVAFAWPMVASAHREADLTPPDIAQPNITVPATAGFGAHTFSANVTFSPTVSDPDDATSAIVVSCPTPNGTTFLAGTTMMTCTATDPAGNHNATTFTVTVTVPPPSFAVPSPITVTATSAVGAVATWHDVTATDVGGQADTVSCDHQSGLTYPIGTTTVRCSASVIRDDSNGTPYTFSSGQATFTVTVTPQPADGSSGSSAGSGGATQSSGSSTATSSPTGAASGGSSSPSTGSTTPSTGGTSSSAGSSSTPTASQSQSGSAGSSTAAAQGSNSGGSSAAVAIEVMPAFVSPSGKRRTVTFDVQLGRAAALHVAILAGGKRVTRFTVAGRKGLNSLSTYVPSSAVAKRLSLQVTISAGGQTQTIVEPIAKHRRR